MPREKSPAFQFYPADFLADDKVTCMSSAAKGAYIVLLCQCWLHQTLPNDPQQLRRLAHYEGRHWSQIWPQLRPCFVPYEGIPGRGGFQQPRIEKERQKQAHFRSHGRKGGLQSANSRQAKANSSSSSSSSSSDKRDPTDIRVISKARAPIKSESVARAPSEKIQGNQKTTVLSGSLPREHLTHALCDETYSRCVPAAVHAKFINLLAPRHSGDRNAAAEALKAWYVTVWATLPTDAVLGDAFKFWQPWFDSAFVNTRGPTEANPLDNPEAMVAGVRELLKKQGFYDDR